MARVECRPDGTIEKIVLEAEDVSLLDFFEEWLARVEARLARESSEVCNVG